ncbi:CDGSH iron-sulfur domain-containing protein [Aquimarina brevivitae]|uniref:Iron-binding CDGSH zinc finger protein n=1 Tax=Aquimarina brevivitae TaxID=323412 RepID=A0A4V2F5E8_9FLAO|nr:CDGSH iron-sulfur domain-containing protein [Aquimarina brevivitae]RZS92569.1 iron-binding CDGSH zinc finger protein [Aquimarina brevivitae]
MSTPKRAGNEPIAIELEKDKRYAWCSCGYSEDQPFCNGAHKKEGGIPIVFTVVEEKKAYLCTCKLTKTPPYCDGTHKV